MHDDWFDMQNTWMKVILVLCYKKLDSSIAFLNICQTHFMFHILLHIEVVRLYFSMTLYRTYDWQSKFLMSFSNYIMRETSELVSNTNVFLQFVHSFVFLIRGATRFSWILSSTPHELISYKRTKMLSKNWTKIVK